MYQIFQITHRLLSELLNFFKFLFALNLRASIVQRFVSNSLFALVRKLASRRAK